MCPDCEKKLTPLLQALEDLRRSYAEGYIPNEHQFEQAAEQVVLLHETFIFGEMR